MEHITRSYLGFLPETEEQNIVEEIQCADKSGMTQWFALCVCYRIAIYICECIIYESHYQYWNVHFLSTSYICSETMLFILHSLKWIWPFLVLCQRSHLHNTAELPNVIIVPLSENTKEEEIGNIIQYLKNHHSSHHTLVLILIGT